MELSQLDLDRNINRLRIHSVEFSELSDECEKDDRRRQEKAST